MGYPEAVPLSEEQSRGVSLVSGTAFPELAEEIAEVMGIGVDPVEHRQFANTEVYSRFEESVRGKRVVIIQSLAALPNWSVNEGLMQLALMANAARGGSAREVTAVVPYLAYGRQDRKARGREPVSAQVVLDILAVSGVNRIVTVDPHSPQVQIGLRAPFDQLIAEPILQEELSQHITAHDADYMIIAPDSGRAKVAEQYSENLTEMTAAIRDGRPIGNGFMSKRRLPGGKVVHKAPEGVRGKSCIVIDDMVDTATTLISAVDELGEAGANEVIVAATHGIFSEEALSKIGSSAITRVIVTDTLPMGKAKEALGPDRLRVLPIAPLIGRALVEIVTDGSVSQLFAGYRQYQ